MPTCFLLQKLTDEYVKKLDTVSKQKEKVLPPFDYFLLLLMSALPAFCHFHMLILVLT